MGRKMYKEREERFMERKKGLKIQIKKRYI